MTQSLWISKNESSLFSSYHFWGGKGHLTVVSTYCLHSLGPSYLWSRSVKSFETCIAQESAGVQQIAMVRKAVLSGS